MFEPYDERLTVAAASARRPLTLRKKAFNQHACLEACVGGDRSRSNRRPSSG